MDYFLKQRIHDIFKRSLSSRLSWSSIMVVTVTLFIVGVVLIFIASNALHEATYSLQKKNADKVAMMIGDYLQNSARDLKLLENTNSLNNKKFNEKKVLLEGLLMYNHTIYNQFTLVDSNGKEELKVSQYHSYLSAELKNQKDNSVFIDAKENGTALSQIFISHDSGLLSLEMAQSIFIDKERYVLIAEINISRLWHDLSEIKIGETGYAYLVDRNGHYIASKDSSLVLRDYGRDMQNIPAVRFFIESINDELQYKKSYPGFNGDEVIGVFSPIEETSWAVIVELPVKEAFASINKMKFFLAALILCGMIFSGSMGFVFSRKIVSHLHNLIEAANKIGKGNLDIKIDKTGRFDEVGVLARTFNQMQNQLKVTYHNLEIQVNELKVARDALQQSEIKYRTIFESSGTAFGLIDEDTLLLMVNNEFEKISGYTKFEVESKMSWTAFVADKNELEKMKEYHYLRRVDPTSVPATYRFHFLTKSSEVRDAVITIVMLPGTKQSIASLVDVTRITQAEKALKASELKFRGVFDQSFQFIVLLDTAGLVLEINQTMLELGNIDQLDYLNKPYWECPWWSPAVDISDKLKDMIGNAVLGSVQRIETAFKGGDNKLHYIDLTIKPVLDGNNNVVLLIAEGRDITDRKISENEKFRLEEQLRQAQKMESIGRLAGGVAHDFNNLLTAIYGNIDIILLTISSDNPTYNRIIEVRKAAESAARLTSQLLAFSRKQIIEPKIVNINLQIKSLSLMIERLIGEDVTLNFFHGEDSLFVRIDPGQLEQIIINMAVNARDAMPDGGVLTIETKKIILDEKYSRTHSYVSKGDYVMLAVSDNGTGMSDEVKKHLFEPFFTTKGLGKGTGLGLATIYGAVKQNNGSIEVYSEKNKGTSFKIYFPLAGVDEKNNEDRIDESETPRGTETILFVEDNPMIIDSSRNILKELGYNVLTAKNGEDAFALVNSTKEKIDLLVTDVVLPGMNGQELADKIQEKIKSIKVIYCSGYTDNAVVTNGVLDNNLNFLGKPYTVDSLARKIRLVIDAK